MILQQLHSVMIDVDAESIARGDTHICLSFTEKAIAVSMNAWKCSGLDSRALRSKGMVDDDNDVHVNCDNASPTRCQRVFTVIDRVVDLGIAKARNTQSGESLSPLGRIRF